MLRAFVASAAVLGVMASHGQHEMMGPLNPSLGTHGFPDCVSGPQGVSTDLEWNQMNMLCAQREGPATALKVACIGDSITAGAHASSGAMAYPGQLQTMVDPNKYTVTNLGACGSTMQKAPNGDSPYWNRPQYQALIKGQWDVVVIMLGTNDAKDPFDGGPNNWHCGTDINAIAANPGACPFVADYLSMVSLVRTLGTTPGTAPQIFIAAPPPLMQHGSIGANQTVINSVYPAIIPLIGKLANVTTVPISIYAALGGVPDWQSAFPLSCQLDSNWVACPWYCDKQSCDQCHPSTFRRAPPLRPQP
jgi:lysophospholipase L1-like esterase